MISFKNPNLSPPITISTQISPKISNLFLKPRIIHPLSSSKTSRFSALCTLNCSTSSNNHTNDINNSNELQFVQIKNPNLPPFISSWRSKFSFSDHALFLFTFIAFTASAALVSFVAAAVPTLYAVGRAANSLAKLADAAREELPDTMTAIRLSGMEISDLTLELSDLSQEVSDGVNKSAQVVKAAEVGIRYIGARALKQTMFMIQESANLPVVSVAANKTSHAIGHAARTFMNFISGGDSNSEEAQ